jgi:hypothetical protein
MQLEKLERVRTKVRRPSARSVEVSISISFLGV